MMEFLLLTGSGPVFHSLLIGRGVLDVMDRQDITEKVTYEGFNNKVLEKIFQEACSKYKGPKLRTTGMSKGQK